MDLTTGQKIAECRKKLGLSQEALGEKMGVSRQAISKWESDSALPEIEKLISLSRLFEVNVGWLLGVEEFHCGDAPKAGVSEELLRKIEEIVLRYRPRKEKLSIGRKVLIGAVLAVILFMGYSFYTQWKITRNEVGYLTGQVRNNNEQNAMILAQLDGLKEQIGARSESAVSLTSYTFDVEPHETENAVILHFHAVPDQWHKDYKAFLVVEFDKKEYVKQQCVWSSSGLRSAVKLEVEDGYSYYLLAEFPDGSIMQIPLENETAENLSTAFTVGITMHSGYAEFILYDQIARLHDYDMTLYFPESMTQCDTTIALASTSYILYGCTRTTYFKPWTQLGITTIYNDKDYMLENGIQPDRREIIAPDNPEYIPTIKLDEADASSMDFFRLVLRVEMNNGMTTEHTLNEWHRSNGRSTEIFSLRESEQESRPPA